MCCACLLLLASLAVNSVVEAASLTGSLQEQQNLACSFVRSARAEDLQPSKHSKCRSTVKCLINELGPPTTDAELFLAHLAAVHDFCTALSGGKLADVGRCNEVPFCRPMLSDADGHALVEAQATEVAWRASHWYHVVAGRPPKYKCLPDWFALLSQPCEGSAAAQMQHCLQDRPDSGACPVGCSYLSLALDMGYCNTARCWPPWVLKQLCDDTVQDFLNSTRLGWCTKGTCPDHCRDKTVASCDKPCVHEACAVVARYVRDVAWTGFQGQCKHTAAVDNLLANAPSMFDGGGCSVRQWIDNSTADLGVLMSKVCQGTYPRPAPLMSFLQNGGALGKVWLDVAANTSVSRPLTTEQLLLRARRSVLSFASTQQAALIQCATGYRAMDSALSKPWLSPELLRAVLPPDSTWRVRLLQGMHTCGSVGNSTDVCLELRGPLKASTMNPSLVPWLVSNTSFSFLESYCSEAFAPAPASRPVLPANVTASCDKISRDTEQVRQRQASRRAALAVIWYAYGVFLLLGFAGLHVYWRLPRQRGRSSRSTWLTSIAECLWHMLCPSVHDYHLSVSQAASAGPPRPATASATWAEWRAWLFSRALSGAQALAYCIDVGLDIWTLVELRKLADGQAALAEAYPTGGGYFDQLNWRSQHTDSLFWWLVIVFVMQYAAGILLTLPPTLAAYDVFNYQRLQFSWGCCTLVFFTGAFGIFVGIFFCVGLWYILVADVYMLLAVVGVPAKLLQGNRLNLSAYTTVRYLCEGILEALPSALISTAILNQQLLHEQKEYTQLGVFWLSLVFSMLRIARELYKLAESTHKLRACCFSTAILDMIYHVQPQQGAGAAPVQGSGAGKVKQGPANTYSLQAPALIGGSCGDSAVVTAPQPDTGMTRDSTGGGPESNLAGGGLLASASSIECDSQQRGSSGSGAAAVAAADTAATVDGDEGGVLHGSSSSNTSKQRSGCCWRCQSCTEYPTVLAVYVYCCLGCIMAYLLLVCSDVIYPWLMAASKGMQTYCSPVDPASRPRCSEQWYHDLPPFRGDYNLLVMITSVPKSSDRSNAAADCVLPSLTCKF